MADNAQKSPAGLSLNRHARAVALNQIWKRGLSLPCTVVAVKGSIVQVSFQIQQPPGSVAPTIPNVTIPIDAFEYIRIPIQQGCKGVARASDAYLGGMSGQGGGVAALTQPGNLGALVFHPISNANWFSVDPNVLVMYGPNGVTLMDQGQSSFVRLSPTEISLTAGGKTITINSAGIVIDGILWETHMHSLVTTGVDDSGPPVV